MNAVIIISIILVILVLAYIYNQTTSKPDTSKPDTSKPDTSKPDTNAQVSVTQTKQPVFVVQPRVAVMQQPVLIAQPPVLVAQPRVAVMQTQQPVLIAQPKIITYPSFSLVKKMTAANDYGGGNTIFLDRHDATCDDKSALNSLRLNRPSEAQIELDYTCASAGDIGPFVPNSTPFSDDGGGNTAYLDRHALTCPDGQALGRVHLKRNDVGNQIQYEYDCRTVPNLGNCVKKTTGANDAADGSSIYLDRHNIACDANQVMTKLHLNRLDNNQFQYEYTCCSR